MKAKKVLLTVSVAYVVFLSMWACSKIPRQAAGEVAAVTAPVERPEEVWVRRSVLDLKPRMLSIALHKNLWVAYNTQTAALYKAWKGGVNYAGAVYTSAHGPQPVTKGSSYYLLEPDGNPWRIFERSQEITPEVVYGGHRVHQNRLTLEYQLKYGNTTVQIEETPEFGGAEGVQVGFERVFQVAGLPTGAQVGLRMEVKALASEADLTTTGTFRVLSKNTESENNAQFVRLEGLLLLNEGPTKISLKLRPRTLQVEEPLLDREQLAMSIMATSDCNACHNRDETTVGPSYRAIAERYDNSDENKDALIKKIITGGAGNWGNIPMTPHPALSKKEIASMVNYIMDLDAEEEKQKVTDLFLPEPSFDVAFQELESAQLKGPEERPGIAVNVYRFSTGLSSLPEITSDMLPARSGALNALHLWGANAHLLENKTVVQATGFLNLQRPTNVVFRLVSGKGSQLFIDGQLVADHSGNHKLAPKDAELLLEAGKHPFRVMYFQGAADRALSLQWRPHGAAEFTVVPPPVFSFRGADIKPRQEVVIVLKKPTLPGDTHPLEGVHPSFTLAQARPAGFKPKVGGMDFFSDGRLVVSTWDSLGSVFLLEGVQGNDPEKIKVKRIAAGLAEPLGLKVVDNQIYVLQKQELTRLVDTDGDDLIDAYQTVCNAWQVSTNFHEFAFGLAYKDGYFYGALATAVNPGGSSTNPQIPDRGKVIKISAKDGSHSMIAGGLRTPNGLNFGVDGELFIADNQGDWLPASKLVQIKEGAWYGSRSVDFAGTAQLPEEPPVVWLPQHEIGNSPSQPILIPVGPYQNQMLHGDVTHGGIKRVFAEKINGAYQGAVFRFSQGLDAGVNRLAWGPDGALYVGGVGSTGNWGHAGKFTYGLQRLTYNGASTFEMLAVRAKADGVEIEFTEALQVGAGEKAADYAVKQWWYKPTKEYGGPKLDEEALPIRRVVVSGDRKKVFLQVAGMKPKHVVYLRLNKAQVLSETGNPLWSTEAWYTLNRIPDQKGELSKK